ncbi:MAG TPA: hypothetical protein VK469_19970 [Candidatus Kapabacteria bacterium]|nr:hypothetical protein [Candidatus Kapabacteria bacterium]
MKKQYNSLPGKFNYQKGYYCGISSGELPLIMIQPVEMSNSPVKMSCHR